ncbi:glycogen/starch synthase [Luteibaculum oceani]|uniref:starch synthase n=1 Tax=Luteibaculum oceani TaxID=1294296 RepID=A0A5C6V1T9_9FLAO|nr:glycogen/starch synthase [Luteibaculum oceani]TXC78974.1 glycogen synthase [Luteibaculum oceani]
MRKPKVLFVSQEITPFLPSNEISDISRKLPQKTQESGKEIRVFMPKYGCINERRHQLHEVIRLSGMNLIIDDNDHPLIIKVASIPAGRMQVYFIDNEEYFQRKAVNASKEGEFFEDNDERAMFFCKGVIETVKKLGWTPDIIHCHGWMSAFLPVYLKKVYHNDPHFSESKVVFSTYSGQLENKLNNNIPAKLNFDGIELENQDVLKNPSVENLYQLGMQYADAVVLADEDASEKFGSFCNELDVNTIQPSEDEHFEACNELYNTIIEESAVLVEE